MPYVITHENENREREVVATLTEPRIERLELLTPDGESLRALSNPHETVFVEQLGGGGFSVVLRARNDVGIHRAVKILAGQTHFLKQSEASVLYDEIRKSSAVPKKHTVPVVDFGQPEDALQVAFSYFATPYLEGMNVALFFRKLIEGVDLSLLSPPDVRERCRTIFFRVLRDAVAGIEELAQEGLIHMDISHSNIHVTSPLPLNLLNLAETEARVAAFLLDFGAARRYSLDRHKQTFTPFVWNPAYFPKVLLNDKNLIGVKENNRWLVDSVKLANYKDRIDLACLARVIEIICFDLSRRGVTDRGGSSFLRAESLKETSWRAVLGDDFQFLEQLVDRLLNVQVAYKTSSEVREIFESLLASSGASPFNSRLLTDQYQGLRLRAGDQLVKVAPPLADVIDHPLLQRLKRLRQLAFVDQVYPGGTHSRFTHSLQVFGLAKRYIASLARQPEFRLEFSGRRVDEVLAASLLHDIGHYPFSHSLEDLRKMGDLRKGEVERIIDMPIAEKRSRLERLKPLAQIKHDHELTTDFLVRTDVEWKYDNLSLSKYLEGHGMDPDAVQYMITKSANEAARPKYQEIGRQLVAGVIDADRVSYLTLDSRETGVAFGRAVDVDSLIESIRVRIDDGHVGLGVEEIGVSAVEAVYAATHWMYRHVYWHRQNRAFMAAIKWVFQRLLESGRVTFDEYLARAVWQDDYFALRWISAKFDRYVKSLGAGAETINPLSNLVDGKRLELTRVLSVGLRVARSDTDVGADPELFSALEQQWSPWLEDAAVDAIRAALKEYVTFKNGDLLIDVPLKPRFPRRPAATPGPGSDLEARQADRVLTSSEVSVATNVLWVKHEHPLVQSESSWMDIRDAYPLAKQIEEAEDREARKVRVFISSSLVPSLPPRIQRELPQIIANALRACVGLASSTAPG